MMNVFALDALSVSESQLIQEAISSQDISPEIFPSMIVKLFIGHSCSGLQTKSSSGAEELFVLAYVDLEKFKEAR